MDRYKYYWILLYSIPKRDGVKSKMAGKYKVEGVCPVCGKVIVKYNPPMPFGMSITQSEKWRSIHAKYPIAVWKCYHTGSPAAAGTPVPMHLFFAPDSDPNNYRRVFPDAGDDCNKKHWKP